MSEKKKKEDELEDEKPYVGTADPPADPGDPPPDPPSGGDGPTPEGPPGG